jgi:hypothetical protein
LSLILHGRAKATCHPSFADQLESAETAGSRVVKDNGLTTSQGPGSAFEFALSLTQQLYDHEKLALVRGPMVCDYYLLSIDLILFFLFFLVISYIMSCIWSLVLQLCVYEGLCSFRAS